MWKIVLGFVVFAALSLFVIFIAGGNIDMGGEKHGADAIHVPEETTPAAAPASAVTPAKSGRKGAAAAAAR
jgi:hypothetical protein